MKKNWYCLLLLALLPGLKAQNFEWVKQFTYGAQPFKVAADKNGNVLTVGEFGYSDFDPGPATYTMASTGNTADVFISKLDSAGGFVWARQLGGRSVISPVDMKTDQLGNVYALCAFRDTIDADPGPGTYSLVGSADFSSLIVKLSPSGNFIWARAFMGNGTCSARSLALDSLQHVYTVGDYAGAAIDLDPGAGVTSVSTSSYMATGPNNSTYTAYTSESYLSKLDANGNFVFAKSNIASASQVAINQSGNIVVMGYVNITIYDAGGIVKWTRPVGINNLPFSFTTDKADNIYITSFFNSALDADPGPGTYILTPAPVNGSLFILKLDSLGNFLWANQVDKLGPQPVQVVSDASGSIYLTSQFGGGVDVHFDFDPNGQQNVLNSGTGRGFIMRVGPDGSFNWVKQLGQGNDPSGGLRPYALTLDDFGNIYTVGLFSGNIDFDPDAGVFTLSSASVIGDGFVHKLSGSLITGLEEQGAEALTIALFPNPTASQVQVMSAKGFTNATCRVIDIGGRLVQEKNHIAGASFSIDLSAQAAGVYVLELADQGIARQFKLIKE